MTTTTAALRRPLVPEDRTARLRPSDHLIRAILADARNQFSVGAYEGAATIAKQLWPDDRPTLEIVQRAATSPATTTTSGWASQLAATSVADLILTLGPASAGSELLRRAISLEFGRSAAISVPYIASASTDVPFVLQGAPIPFRQFNIGNTVLEQHKFGVGFDLTSEMVKHSTPNAERLIRAVVSESVGIALDTALFDATAGSTTRPAGLRNGVTGLTATTGGGDAAMMKDLGALAAAVAGVAGMQIAFVASPGEAVKIALRAGPEFKFPVLASGSLAAGVVVCIALNALAAAIDPQPRFETSKVGLIHQEDTTPLAIGTAGSPNTVAAPTRALWQTDSIGFKLILDVSWGLRAVSGAVSFVTGVTW